MGNKIVIGIDQSYTDTGIAIAYNNCIMSVTDIKTHTKTKISKLLEIRERLEIIFDFISHKSYQLDSCETVCILERTRMVSSKPGRGQFLDYKYIEKAGALNAMIQCVAYDHGIDTYSADTRSWKSKIVGTTKPAPKKIERYGIPCEKWNTIDFCIKSGYEKYLKQGVSNRVKKCFEKDGGRYTYNDNIADAICIALYGFLPDAKLKKEE